MGMVASLVMWPGPFEQTFVPPSQGGSIWTLALIGSVVSEKKMFENVDIQHTHIHIRTTETYLYYKLTNEPKGSGELKLLVGVIIHYKRIGYNMNTINSPMSLKVQVS